MCYSSALFSTSNAETLEEAQHQKIERIFDSLDLPKGSHILEIGSGWGAFLQEAAKRGYQVTGVTISEEQYKHTKKMIDESSYGSSIKVLPLDYRQVQGQYDSIVSIEMFEAVGEKYWGKYFSKVSSCLKPGGKALIQTITIADEHFKNYRKTPDFIQLHIFPGGMLPSPNKFKSSAEKAGLSVLADYPFGQSYARTLQEWLRRFDDAKERIIELGFEEDFIKLWQFYLSYCIAGFTTKRTDVYQFTLQKVAA